MSSAEVQAVQDATAELGTYLELRTKEMARDVAELEMYISVREISSDFTAKTDALLVAETKVLKLTDKTSSWTCSIWPPDTTQDSTTAPAKPPSAPAPAAMASDDPSVVNTWLATAKTIVAQAEAHATLQLDQVDQTMRNLLDKRATIDALGACRADYRRAAMRLLEGKVTPTVRHKKRFANMCALLLVDSTFCSGRCQDKKQMDFVVKHVLAAGDGSHALQAAEDGSEWARFQETTLAGARADANAQLTACRTATDQLQRMPQHYSKYMKQTATLRVLVAEKVQCRVPVVRALLRPFLWLRCSIKVFTVSRTKDSKLLVPLRTRRPGRRDCWHHWRCQQTMKKWSMSYQAGLRWV